VIFDARKLDQCVSCGLCLSSCPTFEVTRAEQHGPRGRIEGMRLIENGTFDVLDPDAVDSMETCVQCRACEAVCPSDVEFGALMEQARAAIASAREQAGSDLRASLLTRVLLAVVHRPRFFRPLTVLLYLSQLTRLDRVLPPAARVARRLSPRDLIPRRRGPDDNADAHLFRGCVMDQWFASVHDASERLLDASGFQVDSSRRSACCGALHLHAGQDATARRLAQNTVDAYEGTDGPVIVNSAGCGAAMHEYGRLLGTEAAERFSARVRDLGEVIQLPAGAIPVQARVVWQAPCHLRYVQAADSSSLALLRSVEGLDVREPSDGHACCGAGGAYSLAQPVFAAEMRERKGRSLDEQAADVVVSANPGCMLHLADDQRKVVHLAEILARALPDRPE
jgi:glycolate oxidase iron-sulfur subunit